MRDSSAHVHPTVKPDQLRRDEVRFVLRGDDLHEQFDDVGMTDPTLSVEEAIKHALRAEGIDFDEIEVERGREPK